MKRRKLPKPGMLTENQLTELKGREIEELVIGLSNNETVEINLHQPMEAIVEEILQEFSKDYRAMLMIYFKGDKRCKTYLWHEDYKVRINPKKGVWFSGFICYHFRPLFFMFKRASPIIAKYDLETAVKKLLNREFEMLDIAEMLKNIHWDILPVGDDGFYFHPTNRAVDRSALN